MQSRFLAIIFMAMAVAVLGFVPLIQAQSQSTVTTTISQYNSCPTPTTSTTTIFPSTTVSTTIPATTTISSSCSGTPVVNLVPNPVPFTDNVNLIVSGLSNCNGETIYIDNWTGCSVNNILTSFISGSTGGNVILTNQTGGYGQNPNGGLYGYWACVNNNPNQSSEGILTVTGSNTPTTTIPTTTTSVTTTTSTSTTSTSTTSTPTTSTGSSSVSTTAPTTTITTTINQNPPTSGPVIGGPAAPGPVVSYSGECAVITNVAVPNSFNFMVSNVLFSASDSGIGSNYTDVTVNSAGYTLYSNTPVQINGNPNIRMTLTGISQSTKNFASFVVCPLNMPNVTNMGINASVNSTSGLHIINITPSNLTNFTKFSNVFPSNVPKLSGYNVISLSNITVTDSNVQSINFTVYYQCVKGMNVTMVPYTMGNNGSWSVVSSYNQNKALCILSFTTPTNPVLALLVKTSNLQPLVPGNTTQELPTVVPSSPPNPLFSWIWALIIAIVGVVVGLYWRSKVVSGAIGIGSKKKKQKRSTK